MKDTTAWKRSLGDYFKKHHRNNLGALTPNQFADVELALYLIVDTLPGVTLDDAVPALLSGNPYTLGETSGWSDNQHHHVRVARFLLGSFRHKAVWRDLLKNYGLVDERIRGFSLTTVDEKTTACRQITSIYPDRFTSYESALATVLPLRTYQLKPIESNRDYTVIATDSTYLHVRFPASFPHESSTKHQLRIQDQRQPLTISLTDLIETARWMDTESTKRGIKSANWAERVERLQIDTYEKSVAQFVNKGQLTLNGATHMVGMLSAGKSTLMDVVAVWAAQNGKRITLIVNDVSDVLSRCNFFYQLGLSVAPMLGKSSREQHLRRLHGMEGENLITQTRPLHRGFHWLSTACSLPAIAAEDSSLSINRRPCLSLMRDGKAHVCPLYGSCAYHNAQRELADAWIWVGTPASMLHTRLDKPLTNSVTQLAELIYRDSDIVIVDEADRVQVQFDLAFSPGQTLANNRYDGWFDALVNHVRTIQTKEGRGIRSDSLVASFSRVLDDASTACEKLYDLLVSQDKLHNWVRKQHHFTAKLLFDELTDDLIIDRKTAHPSLPTIFSSFLDNRDPLGEEDDHELSEYVRGFMATTLHRERLRQQLGNWLVRQPLFGKTLSYDQRRDVTLKLEFTLLLSALENRLNYIVKNWNQVESTFSLYEWGQSLFTEPTREYLSLIPMAPAGNILTFRYEGDEKDTPGRLVFFKNLGVGRLFLLNFHRLYEVDKVAGPHVLLMSGTSWAGSSPSYHVSLPVGTLLRAPEKELEGINQSEFTFWPITGTGPNNRPIKVSGKPDELSRHNALKELVTALVKKDVASGRGQLEVNWRSLPENRQRALFIVGSYREARVVRDHLINVRREWKDAVVALVPDSDTISTSQADAEQSIQRGKVHEFAARGGKILIAPLMAIERGHNILNELGDAAIGTAYFLVRPHPHPDDISLSVKAMNAWAMAHYDRPDWFREKIGHWPADVTELHQCFKREAVSYWNRLMRMPIRFRTLPKKELNAFQWDQLVSIWQVIGRLIRGGVPAKIFFCDAAFAEMTVAGEPDTAQTSLLVGMRDLLAHYLKPNSTASAHDQAIAKALYQPFYQALTKIIGLHHAQDR